jgi:FtsP/CotA-like multicopper oxidase with cupredoxin domain
MTVPANEFSRETSGLPAASATPTVELSEGDRFALRIAPVSKRIGDATVRMLAYNDSIPGPTLRVVQGSEVLIDVENDGDMEATVHWHGLRLENPFDGTHETQDPVAVGGSFSARVTFPDAGAYWYHPHIRDFGNVLLVAGEPELALTARAGEVVRLYLTNTANTRVFKVALPGARMKLVGGDSGRCEREEFVEDVVLAPSERAVVDVRFETPGQLTLEHRTPGRTYTLAKIAVAEGAAAPSLATEFEILRTDPELTAERERLTPLLDEPPDKTLATNVGRWMAHCHIAEHHKSGMMFSFDVTP